MKKYRKQNSTGCLWTLFFYTLLACIIYTVYDYMKTYLPTASKLMVIIIYITVPLLLLLKLFGVFRRRYSITQLDAMEGHAFEYACANILRDNGFKKVKVTQGSGDYGVDITAEKKGKRYAVQCKRYSHKLDNSPIQEVKAGLVYYHCDVGAVMTNQTFTEPAKELARINGIQLWDRNVLIEMLKKPVKNNRKKSTK